DECKKLLPSEFQISEPNSLRDCSFQTNKKALYHIHTCKNSKCSILENQEYNYKNIYSYFFKQIFTTYPAPKKDSTIPQKTPYNPNFFIFSSGQQYATIFKKPIPLHTLNKLAFKADKTVQNNNISELGLEQVLEKTIVPTIDPHILAI
ncbi:27259_t:CDS:2, partial [Gigaspora margarita]